MEVTVVDTGATTDFDELLCFDVGVAPLPHNLSTNANLSGVSFAYQNLLARCHLNQLFFSSVRTDSSGIPSKDISRPFFSLFLLNVGM